MGGIPPCASCKLLRRRCAENCIFAPYFPSDDPQKFAIVHKVFGASNVGKMLQELRAEQRADAVSSLVYEANARVRDPVYGSLESASRITLLNPKSRANKIPSTKTLPLLELGCTVSKMTEAE
ncbi:LOB domain-containing protein 12-like [Senna tora]|uniref:LOB domain-containing protein 12-like n=1 Tax=Senna tora TaxID=362788 RepID=A0A834WS50_9FABA|nr:LOB domain-containing protein 12-like [Senna tora]